jgi:hypothetical protein
MPTRKGKLNKNKKFLLGRLKDLYGEDFHPIMRMAENAVKLQEIAENEEDSNAHKAALDGWEKIAQYVEPKLKAVEVTGADGKDLIPDSIKVKYE